MSQLSKDRGILYARAWLLLVFLVLPQSTFAARTDPNANLNKLRWSTDSTGPARFISVHGRRAAVFGYSKDGLEAWAYPFQILSGYQVNFRRQAATTEIEGKAALRRIEYSPMCVTRIYAGPDFIVHERIFVPLDEPGAIIRYDVASARPLDIVVRFIPVLDLMWPGGIGGQEALWNPAASAYLLSEPTHRFSGSIGSPDIVAHDETPNENRRLDRESGMAFTMRAGGDHAFARVIIAGGPERSAASIASKLLEQEEPLWKVATAHYSELLEPQCRSKPRMRMSTERWPGLKSHLIRPGYAILLSGAAWLRVTGLRVRHGALSMTGFSRETGWLIFLRCWRRASMRVPATNSSSFSSIRTGRPG